MRADELDITGANVSSTPGNFLSNVPFEGIVPGPQTTVFGDDGYNLYSNQSTILPVYSQDQQMLWGNDGEQGILQGSPFLWDDGEIFPGLDSRQDTCKAVGYNTDKSAPDPREPCPLYEASTCNKPKKPYVFPSTYYSPPLLCDADMILRDLTLMHPLKSARKKYQWKTPANKHKKKKIGIATSTERLAEIKAQQAERQRRQGITVQEVDKLPAEEKDDKDQRLSLTELRQLTPVELTTEMESAKRDALWDEITPISATHVVMGFAIECFLVKVRMANRTNKYGCVGFISGIDEYCVLSHKSEDVLHVYAQVANDIDWDSNQATSKTAGASKMRKKVRIIFFLFGKLIMFFFTLGPKLHRCCWAIHHTPIEPSG